MLLDTGLKIHRGATVVIPADIGRTMVGIAGILPNAGLEFGLYLKGVWDPAKATVTVQPNEFYFPEQEVTSVSIRFLEDPPSPEWNVVIHRHPQSCRTFSQTDKDSINEEFLASILFIPMWEFPEAVVNIPLGPGSKFQTPARVKIDGGLLEVPDWLVDRVHQNLKQLRVTNGPGVQKAGRGTIECLDGDGTVRSDLPERSVTPGRRISPLRVGPRAGMAQGELPGLPGANSHLDFPLTGSDAHGFAPEDLEEMRDALRESSLGKNT